jgi:hypothetical protein
MWLPPIEHVSLEHHFAEQWCLQVIALQGIYLAHLQPAPSHVETVWKFLPQCNPQDPPVNLMEVFHSLDGDTLRQVLSMGSLKESELREFAARVHLVAVVNRDTWRGIWVLTLVHFCILKAFSLVEDIGLYKSDFIYSKLGDGRTVLRPLKADNVEGDVSQWQCHM